MLPDLGQIQALINSLLLLLRVLCWLDELLGLNIIPDELCSTDAEETA